jgi:hypothetical protein
LFPAVEGLTVLYCGLLLKHHHICSLSKATNVPSAENIIKVTRTKTTHDKVRLHRLEEW